MGYAVEPSVTGPYEVMAAQRVGDGSDGGVLDRGLIARTEDGRRVVIGEIWAAGVGSGGSKVRLDAPAVASDVVRHLNAFPEMYDVLDSIENDDGKVPGFLWDRIQAVLAKARGETS